MKVNHCNVCWRRGLRELADSDPRGLHPEDAYFIKQAADLIDELQPDCPECAEIKRCYPPKEAKP